jgi:transposase-like protein
MGVAKFRCPHCDKHFSKKFNLQVHLRNIEKKLSSTKDEKSLKEVLKIKGFLSNLDKKK